ncbi:MAG: shikimate dehydrogenase [Clostridia bacterium]|nr:shikimate dehydrogenase [Clostridia bacterium]
MYGLLGEHLPHSFSPQIHKSLGNKDYTLFEISPENLEKFLKEKSYKGINVTIPYKKAVIPFLDFISPEAEKISAINTVVVRDGRLCGYNTDYFGFKYMIEKSGIVLKDKKALVLGSGGASATVQAVLRDMGASDVIVVSRNGEFNYTNIYNEKDVEIIVNTTPVGMYPDNMNTVVDVSRFDNLSGVLDVVYNPLKTRLVMEAEKIGIKTATGLSMLVAQAKKAHEIFFDTVVDDEVCDQIEKSIRLQMCNIVLIGMAGCGKSTVGEKLSEILKKDFIDTDEMIVNAENKPIPRIFEECGEKYFRTCENVAVNLAGREKNSVIATGGGVVTRLENYMPLKQNGIIVFINREWDKLPIKGRPLSVLHGVKELYEQRMPMYRQFADIEVDGNGTVEETAKIIVKEILNYENSCN